MRVVCLAIIIDITGSLNRGKSMLVCVGWGGGGGASLPHLCTLNSLNLVTAVLGNS